MKLILGDYISNYKPAIPLIAEEVYEIAGNLTVNDLKEKGFHYAKSSSADITLRDSSGLGAVIFVDPSALPVDVISIISRQSKNIDSLKSRSEELLKFKLEEVRQNALA